MKTEYILSFNGASETAIAGDLEQEGRLGTALLAYLSIDFASIIARVEHFKSDRDNIRSEVGYIRRKFANVHPFPAQLISSAELEEDDGTKLLWLLNALKGFQHDIYVIAEELFMDESTEVSSLQRLCALCCGDSPKAKMFSGLKGAVHTDRRFFVEGKEIQPRFCSATELEAPCKMESRLYFVSESMQAILLTEVQQMAEQSVILRKCQNCGGLFLPYSGKAIYCDRIIPGTDKSCKEFAAKDKYQKKVASDEALTLYRRRSKTYSMRVLRSDSLKTAEEYNRWKQRAEEALQRYNNEEISFEEFDAAVSLPKKQPKT